jgi:hypothetical protein
MERVEMGLLELLISPLVGYGVISFALRPLNPDETASMLTHPLDRRLN